MSEPLDSRRVAAVTGGTRGIGRAVAQALLEDGYAVVVGGRSGEPDPPFSDFGPDRVRSVALDVRDADSCRGFVGVAEEAFGGLDVLVNNAGIGVFGAVDELAPEDWHLQIDVNLTGVYQCSAAAIPLLAEGDEGWIINVGSLASRHAFAGGAGYNASKFGLLGLTEAMMLDLRERGIRVTIVMPGSVDTGFRGQTPGAAPWKLAGEDVARAIADLLRYPGRALPSRIELRPTRTARS